MAIVLLDRFQTWRFKHQGPTEVQHLECQSRTLDHVPKLLCLEIIATLVSSLLERKNFEADLAC